jgi:hypothetical protein
MQRRLRRVAWTLTPDLAARAWIVVKERHRCARARSGRRGVQTSGTGADDDNVEALSHRVPAPSWV